MITSIVIFSILIILLTVYLSLESVRKPKNYPPGPKWLPFFGCNFTMKKFSKEYGSQWKALSELRKLYSTDVLGLKLGKELVVVFFGEENIRRMFLDKEFEGRPDTFFARLRCLGTRSGITFTDGQVWKTQRAFTVKNLRNVGFVKTLMEKEIQTETCNFIKCITEKDGHSIHLRNIIAKAVLNVLWKYVAGENIKEEGLEHMLDLFNSRSKAFVMAGGWLNLMPWCRYLFPDWTGYNIIKNLNKELSYLIEEIIQKHKSNLIEGKDFIYSYLDEIDASEDFTEEQLKVICMDLIIAGSQTTSNALLFAFLAALKHPDMQDKVYDEIDRVIGDRLPCWSDNYSLIYTSAFLLEVQRYFTIAPLVGPRRVLFDTYVDGYFIPKETTVMSSIGDLHMDPAIWDQPNEFNPERFIDDTGALKNSEHVYTFGLGRRRCPGDSLGKSFLFIAFVGVIQKFKVVCANGVLPSDEPIIGLLASPKPFQTEFILRKKA
uniref:Cytochrome P450 CYP305B1 n=1 Tax=Zygaena filipendulae TaxID=287375 RepID=A0A286MXN2_9NEOP|nr:cytochrome P450 CYP305B1 [Zygaena filipendulae]